MPIPPLSFFASFASFAVKRLKPGADPPMLLGRRSKLSFPGEPMSLGQRYLERHRDPMRAYMALQCDMLRRYIRFYGGSGVDFVERHHAAFRQTFGWMLQR